MCVEIRTPLCGILGSIDLLQQTRLNSEQQEWMHITEVCGQQLGSIIDDILDVTKLEVWKTTGLRTFINCAFL